MVPNAVLAVAALPKGVVLGAVEGAKGEGDGADVVPNGEVLVKAAPNGVGFGLGRVFPPKGDDIGATLPPNEGLDVALLPNGDELGAITPKVAGGGFGFAGIPPNGWSGDGDVIGFTTAVPNGEVDVNGVEETFSPKGDVGGFGTAPSPAKRGSGTLYFLASLENISFSLPLYFARLLSTSPTFAGLCLS